MDTGKNEKNIPRIVRKCAVSKCQRFGFRGEISRIRETMKRIFRENVGNLTVPWCQRFGIVGKDFVGTGEMCQHHGACFLDVVGTFRGYGR